MSRNSQNRFLRSFAAAGSGIWQAIRQERNLRFHLVAVLLVLYGRSFYSFSAAEDAALFLTMGSVIAAELVNTAVECAVDLCCPRPNPLAKLAKDAAAGAVLVLAIAAVLVGLRLFWQPQILLQVVELHLRSPLRLLLVLLAAAAGGWFVFFFEKGKAATETAATDKKTDD